MTEHEGTPAHMKAMGNHGQIAKELANHKMNDNARRIWKFALSQPEFSQVSVVYGYAPMSSSDHRNGRCMDFMITIVGVPRDHQVSIGDAIRRFFIRHQKDFHVQGIIWNRHVTGFGIGGPGPTYSGPYGQNRPYHGASSHTDHVHVQVTGDRPSFDFLKDEDPMPSPDALWNADDIPAPNVGQTPKEVKDNPTWKAKNALREAVEQAYQANQKVIALEKKVDAILAAVGPKSDAPKP